MWPMFRRWCGRRLCWTGRKRNLGSSALRNVRRRRFSTREISQSGGFHLDRTYIFGLARGMSSSLPTKTLRICRSLCKRSILLSILSVGRRGVRQKLTPSPNSDCNALGVAFSWTDRAIWHRQFSRYARSTAMRFWSALLFLFPFFWRTAVGIVSILRSPHQGASKDALSYLCQSRRRFLRWS